LRRRRRRLGTRRAQQENGDGGDESRQAGATVSRRRPFTRGRGGRRMRRGRRGCADAPETGKMDGLGWIAAHQESSRMHCCTDAHDRPWAHGARGALERIVRGISSACLLHGCTSAHLHVCMSALPYYLLLLATMPFPAALPPPCRHPANTLPLPPLPCHHPALCGACEPCPCLVLLVWPTGNTVPPWPC
jgi:hypothetical protein